jgi:hypothetical protein
MPVSIESILASPLARVHNVTSGFKDRTELKLNVCRNKFIHTCDDINSDLFQSLASLLSRLHS